MAPAVLAIALGAGTASAATLKADYQLQDSRESSVAGAPALTDLVGMGNAPNSFITDSVGGASRRVLAFPQGNGLAVSPLFPLLPSGSYSVVILVRLDEVGSYRRYLDLTGGTSDTGFYNQSGSLILYPVAGGTSNAITANVYHRVTLTRDTGGTVVGYVDGKQALGPYDDSASAAAALSADTLRIFKDDDAISSEESGGAVAGIRVYDGALTADEVAAFEAPQPPVLGKAVNIVPKKGEVFVSVPRRKAGKRGTVPGLKGRRFVPLSEVRQIPVGSILDTRKGTVGLTTASGKKGRTQSATFGSGVFQVLQSRRRKVKGLTELRLKGASFRPCKGRRKGKRSAGAQASRRSRRVIRRLSGSGKGRFRTRGRNSAATVRGTKWLVADRCDGTLTKVKRGRVAVRDFRRKKTIVVTAGKSYLARAR